MSKVLNMVKKVWLWIQQYGVILFQWFFKTFKVQMRKMSKASARKELAKAHQNLGAEMYAHFKQGVEIDWEKMPGAQQQLKRTEEAETKLFAVDESIDTVKDRFSAKKEEINKKYGAKRASIS